MVYGWTATVLCQDLSRKHGLLELQENYIIIRVKGPGIFCNRRHEGQQNPGVPLELL